MKALRSCGCPRDGSEVQSIWGRLDIVTPTYYPTKCTGHFAVSGGFHYPTRRIRFRARTSPIDLHLNHYFSSKPQFSMLDSKHQRVFCASTLDISSPAYIRPVLLIPCDHHPNQRSIISTKSHPTQTEPQVLSKFYPPKKFEPATSVSTMKPTGFNPPA
jgi:hypothetical protein